MKKVTLIEKLIVVVSYHNKSNDLSQNINTVGGILKVLRDRKKDVMKYLETNQNK